MKLSVAVAAVVLVACAALGAASRGSVLAPATANKAAVAMVHEMASKYRLRANAQTNTTQAVATLLDQLEQRIESEMETARSRHSAMMVKLTAEHRRRTLQYLVQERNETAKAQSDTTEAESTVHENEAKVEELKRMLDAAEAVERAAEEQMKVMRTINMTTLSSSMAAYKEKVAVSKTTMDEAVKASAESMKEALKKLHEEREMVRMLRGVLGVIRSPASCKQARLAQRVGLNGKVGEGAVYVLRMGDVLDTDVSMVTVMCTVREGHDWAVIMRHHEGKVDFYRTYSEYEEGFGELMEGGDFWIGLRNVSRMTRDGLRLRVEVSTTDDSQKAWEEYSKFSVGDAASGYTLTCTGPSGNAGDSMSYHSGAKFSTKDRDQDQWSSNCAVSYHGGWWYKACHHSNLMGGWGRSQGASMPCWYHWKGHGTTIKSEMLVLSE